MDKADIEQLRSKGVNDIKAALPDLDAEALAELLAQETAADKPRKGVTDAVEAELAARNDDDTPDEDEPEASPKAKAGETPAWQKPDYHGPLDGEQAAWRNAHLK